jgi:ankyrin repeat protein
VGGSSDDLEIGNDRRGDRTRKGQNSSGVSQPEHNNTPQGIASKSGDQGEFTIVQPDHASAPNVSLNLHNRTGRGELRIVATFGTLLQLGVLVYGGFITYYPRLTLFRNGQSPVKRYAFPLTAMGTIVLVFGMLVCCHVVESSTEETSYRPRGGMNAHILWLQRKQTVSDQAFDSSVIIARGKRNVVTTSRRRQVDSARSTSVGPAMGSEGQSGKGETVQKGLYARSPHEKPRGNQANLEISATVGALTSLCGFVMQFVGFRGMHWSITVMQLGVTLVMAAMRALVRRGLVEHPFVQPLDPGFELDWLSGKLEKLSRHGGTPWPESSLAEKEEDVKKFWSVDSHDRVIMGVEDPNTCEALRIPGLEGAVTRSHKTMKIRKFLGSLSKWSGPASNEALSVAAAIEVVMNSLFPQVPGCLAWSLRTVDNNAIDFELIKPERGKWVADAAELEAALSLWLFAIRLEETPRREVSSSDLPEENGLRLRPKGAPGKRGMRFLGQQTHALHRDLRWWMTGEAGRIMIAEEANSPTGGDGDRLEIQAYRVVGCGRCSPNTSKQIAFATRELPKAFGNDAVVATENAGSFLGTVSDSPLSLLFAQHIFSVFMWAAVKKLEHPITGGVEILPGIVGTDPAAGTLWKSFTLQNSTILKLVQDIRSTGIGSMEEVYLSIVPPLSAERKLPKPETVIELARRHTKAHEQLDHWEEAGDEYLWLFRTCMSFDPKDDIAIEATAVLLEFLRNLTRAIQLRQKQKYGEGEILKLVELQSKIEEELRKADGDILKRFRIRLDIESPYSLRYSKLYQPLVSLDGRFSATTRDPFRRTQLHYSVVAGDTARVGKLFAWRADANAKDLMEWTPLHYASLSNQGPIIWTLLQEGAEVGFRGRDGKAPLHCAAMEGHVEVARILVEAGADVNVVDASRSTPLHWAAYNGHLDMTQYLWQEANRKMREQNGRTPLHLAVVAGRGAVVSHLLQMGAEARAGDRKGQMALHLAALSGHHDVFRQLLGHLKAKNNITEENGMGRLDASAEGNGRTEKLEADIDARDGQKRSALHLAAEGGHVEMICVLVQEFKANTETQDMRGQTPLHYAALLGHVDATRVLARDLKADIEAQDVRMQTPLHHAALGGHTGAIRVLVQELKANTEAKDKEGYTALGCAIVGRHVEAVRVLVQELKVNTGWEKSTDWWYLLHQAVLLGQVEIVRVLVQELAVDDTHRVDLDNQSGETVLHTAAKLKHNEIIRMLVRELKANIEVQDLAGKTALHSAAALGNIETVRVLAQELKANINAQDRSGSTALHLAAEDGHAEMIRVLVQELKAITDVQDVHKQTPLHIAALRGHVEAIRVLAQESKASIEAQDAHMQTPLHYAASGWYTRAIRVLVQELKANVNAQDQSGSTALHLAAEDGHVKLIRVLVQELRANTDVQDVHKQTPLHCAAIEGRAEAVRVLVHECKADTKVQDDKGQTALQIATSRGYDNVIQVLGELE